MDELTTIWNVAAASLAVWRLSRLLLDGKGRGRILPTNAANVFAGRALDCLCWLSIWFSAQTAVWVAGGLTGVVLNCFVFSHLSRMSTSSFANTTAGSTPLEAPTASRGCVCALDSPCFAVECGMQAHHG